MQCTAITQKGTRCKFKSTTSSNLCTMHQKINTCVEKNINNNIQKCVTKDKEEKSIKIIGPTYLSFFSFDNKKLLLIGEDHEFIIKKNCTNLYDWIEKLIENNKNINKCIDLFIEYYIDIDENK